MRWLRRPKALLGMQLCRFGIWFNRKTACLAHEPEHFDRLASEEKDFSRLHRQFKIQASGLNVVKSKAKFGNK